MKYALLALAVLAGCNDEASRTVPEPITMTQDAAGYYCQMLIVEHEGPKGQLFLKGFDAPVWFSQVRDALVYLKSPEQEAEILVLYVNDMGEAASYAEPGIDNWLDAREAYYVVGSDAVGGMGAPEIVPFGSPEAAAVFIASHGGSSFALDEISAETVMAPVELNLPNAEN